MAFRAAFKHCRLATSVGRPFASSTTPKFAASSVGNLESATHHPHYNKYSLTGDFAPVYMVMGMLGVAGLMAVHTAKQQLCHSPGVNISKKRRGRVAEVEDPDLVVSNSDKFINKSFLRKVAHIQDRNPTLPDPSRPNPFSTPRDAQTLKTVGVNPRNH